MPTGERRGQLTSLSDRQHCASLIDEAVVLGARKEKACEEIDMSIRTLQRWLDNGAITADKRPTAKDYALLWLKQYRNNHIQDAI